ncbi:hypothetical protein ACJX0J_020281, partial [Zea mays]
LYESEISLEMLSDFFFFVLKSIERATLEEQINSASQPGALKQFFTLHLSWCFINFRNNFHYEIIVILYTDFYDIAAIKIFTSKFSNFAFSLVRIVSTKPLCAIRNTNKSN